MDKPLKSVTHGQCDARSTVTFPAAEHHRLSTGTKLLCLVTEAQRAQGCYLKSGTAEIRTRDLLSRKYNALTTPPPGHKIDSAGKCFYAVFNEHKACLMRLGEHGPAIEDTIREQCGMYATTQPAGGLRCP